jgi:peptide/nickel transport system permease protein
VGAFLLRRLALMAATLVIVSVLVFALAEVLPGDVGRTILGHTASAESVAELDHELGYDRPLAVRYGDWLQGFVRGDWGESVVLQTPIRPLVVDRLLNSLQLALVALLVIVPISIGLGTLAALREDGLADRVISVTGLSLTAIPEFVSGVVLLVVFAVGVSWFPVTAEFPAGANPITRLHHLFLPSIPLMLVLFGYIARMARAGAVEALRSAYVRSAVLKGLPWRHIVIRHVLRNSLLPTITVIGAQVGWLVGGLVVVETLFSYQGIGKLMLDSAIGHDIPVLEATTLIVAVFFMASNLVADVLYGILNPRIRSA